MSFWPWLQALNCSDHILGFTGLGKPSSPVTNLSNEAAQDDGWARSHWGPRLHPESKGWFRLSRDFTNYCHIWNPGGHACDVLVRFFPCKMYIDSNRHDTLEYEWPLVRCSHLVVCLVVLTAWIRGCCLWLCYHNDYCIYFTYDVDFCQCSACLYMF
jgi:hypothetical protein